MKGQKKKMQDIRHEQNCIAMQTKPKVKLNNSNGITLVALIVSIIVMLVLAGVSINAVVGDNGIITQAQNATYETSCAVLEEWLNQLYVENYDNLSSTESKAVALSNMSQYSGYFYNPARDSGVGSLTYVVDSSGRALYLIKKSGLPSEIQNQLAGGDADDGSYESYQSLIDVYGVTSDLRVYYCNNGAETITGLTVADLDVDDIDRTVNFSDSNMKTLLTSLGYANSEGEITAKSLRSLKELEITASSGVTSLADLYNCTSLQKLTLNGVEWSSLSGIEGATQLNYIYFKSCVIGDYSSLCSASKLTYLYFYNIDDEELATACTDLASAEFSNLAYLGAFGEEHAISYFATTTKSYVYSTKSTNQITTLEPLSKLSSTTQSSVKYLAINNESLTGDLSYLSSYTNLISLRCEYNSLTSLNGLNCSSTLTYLTGCNNQLGATTGSDNNTVAEDTTDGTAIKSLEDNTKLYYVNLENNTYLANVSYFENDTAIRYLYLSGCNSLMSVTAIATILDNCTAYSLSVLYLSGKIVDMNSYIDTMSELTDEQLETYLLNNTTITHLKLENATSLSNTVLNEVLRFYD